jgi:hypothetical protein
LCTTIITVHFFLLLPSLEGEELEEFESNVAEVK